MTMEVLMVCPVIVTKEHKVEIFSNTLSPMWRAECSSCVTVTPWRSTVEGAMRDGAKHREDTERRERCDAKVGIYHMQFDSGKNYLRAECEDGHSVEDMSRDMDLDLDGVPLSA